MIDCAVIGDSIAVGTHMHRPECVAYAKGGWNTWQWNNSFLTKATTQEYKTVIISLGSNDHKYVRTRRELETMRTLIKAERVFWVLPAGNLPAGGVNIVDIQSIVKDIAKQHGDVVLPIASLSKDGIHPTGRGYKDIAEKTK
jgi:lysophospholipase L1-like esterase